MAAASATNSLKQLSSWKVVGGYVRKYLHFSSSTNTEMKFSVFFPPSLSASATAAAAAPAAATKVPTLYWLSGLTCTDDNFMHKAGAFSAAAAANVALVCPDTSPRGLNLPEEKNTAISGQTWDFGEGAGFYVNATAKPFDTNYHMYRYVNEELPALLASADFGLDAVEKRGIFGHSMGGHGALISFLKNPGKYKSVSAFAPICNPSNCDWGKKAFGGYLSSPSEWAAYDATELVKQYQGPAAHVLIEQGGADDFLSKGQLLPEKFQAAAADSKVKVTYNLRDGYDHSYFFIQTFVADHIQHHAKQLYA